MYYLNVCYLTRILSHTQVGVGLGFSGIQATVKANELSSAMTVRRHGFHNDVLAYMLQLVGKYYSHNFCCVGSFMITVFSCKILSLMVGFYQTGVVYIAATQDKFQAKKISTISLYTHFW